MFLKKIVTITIISLLLGILLFFLIPSQKTTSNNPLQKVTNLLNPSPTPIPTPTIPPINESTNLKEEIKKQSPEYPTLQIESLKQELNNF